MAEENNRLTLLGMWASPYSKRVEFALRVKGIEYEYVEEDLRNKSESLLHYNPVHKKIPVLVHNGKAIAESLVILEYINETWKEGPKLLPEDPYERAEVRFWTNFVQQQLFETIVSVLKSEGEKHDKGLEQLHQNLKLLEEAMGGCFPAANFPSILKGENDNMGLLDMVMSSVFSPIEAYEEVFGVKLVNPSKYPLVSSWVKSLNEVNMVKELSPPHDKLVGFLRYIRKRALKSAAA